MASPMEGSTFVALWSRVHPVLPRAELTKILCGPMWRVASRIGHSRRNVHGITNFGTTSLKSSIFSLPAGVSPMFTSIKTIGRCVEVIVVKSVGKNTGRTRFKTGPGAHAVLQLKPPSTFVSNMSYFLPHLPSGWHVDEAIKSEEDRVVVIRFGHDWDTQCMVMDETLYSVAEKVQNFAVIYLCDITEVPDFNKVCLSFDFFRFTL